MATSGVTQEEILFWGMTLDDKEFKAKIKEAKGELQDLDDEAKTSLSGVAKEFAVAAAAIGVAALAMFKFGLDTAAAIAEQKLLADSLGVTTTEMIGLELATTRLFVDTQMVLDKMKEFGGIDEFKKLADEVKNAGGAQAQLNKAIEIFGNEGAKILPILQQGSAGLKEFEQEAVKTGLALSPEKVAETAKIWGEWDKQMAGFKGLFNQIGAEIALFIPLAAKLVEITVGATKATGEIIQGTQIWVSELFGLEDATSKAFTAEEQLAIEANAAAKALEKQDKITIKLIEDQKKLTEELNKPTFSKETFGAILVERDLKRLQQQIGLSARGFDKIKGAAASAFGRGESFESVLKTAEGLKNVNDFFQPQDFAGAGKFLGESLDDAFGEIDKLEKELTFELDLDTLFGDLDEAEKQITKNFDKRQKKVKALTADPAAFATTALAGSVEAFRILMGTQDTSAKETAKNTAKTNKLLEKLGAI